MEVFLHGLALFLLANIAAAMVRVFRGPTTADRLMSAQLFGTTGVAIILLQAEALDLPALRNVALVFVLLAVLVTLSFVRQTASAPEDTEPLDKKQAKSSHKRERSRNTENKKGGVP